MKLIELRIKNFRGLGGDKNVIKFQNSNVIILVGQNNAGKSSILKAYEFFVNPKQKAIKQDFFQYDTKTPIVIEGDFLFESGDKNDSQLKNKEPDWIQKWVQKDKNLVTVKKKWETEGSEFNKYTKNQAGDFEKDGFGGLHQYFSKYTPTPIFIKAIETEVEFEKQVNKILEDQHLKKLETTCKQHYDTAIKAIQKIQSHITSLAEIQKHNDEINKSFKKIFPKLELKISVKDEDNGIDILKAFKTNHSIDVLKSGTDRKETFSQHGHGVIRQAFFNFLTFMKNTVERTNKKEYLLLFEEPELYLHPISIKLLKEELYNLAENSPFQIMCCTHNPQLIDISKQQASIVRLIKHENETTEIFQVSSDVFHSNENKDYIQMINRFNPHVCEVFYADNVIIVEGDTESIVCRELLNEYAPEREIFVLNSGSKANIPFYQRILNHFRIPYTVIHDSDTRCNYKDKKTGEKNGDGKNSAWTMNENIWREIENGKEQGNIVHRLVSVYDFEYENKYTVNSSKGKPLSAYKFIQANKKSEDLSICKFIHEIIDAKYSKEWTQKDIEEIEEPQPKKNSINSKNTQNQSKFEF